MTNGDMCQTLFLHRRSRGQTDQAGGITVTGRITGDTLFQGIHGDVLAHNLAGRLAGAVEITVTVTHQLSE